MIPARLEVAPADIAAARAALGKAAPGSVRLHRCGMCGVFCLAAVCFRCTERIEAAWPDDEPTEPGVRPVSRLDP